MHECQIKKNQNQNVDVKLIISSELNKVKKRRSYASHTMQEVKLLIQIRFDKIINKSL